MTLLIKQFLAAIGLGGLFLLPIAGAAEISASADSINQTQPSQRLSLSRVFKQVAASTPAIKEQQERVRQAEAQRSAAKGAFLPQFGLSLQSLRSQNYSETGSIIVGESVVDSSESFYTSYASLSAQLSLFSGGQNLAGLNAASSEVSANKAELEALEINEYLQAFKLYINLSRKELAVKSNRRRKALLERRYLLAKRGFEEGRLANTTVQSARIDWMDVRSELLQQQTHLQQISSDLRRHLGLKSQGNSFRTDISSLPSPPVLHLVDPHAHIANHPSLLAASQRMKAARRQLESAQGTLLPKLSLIANYSWLGVDSQGITESLDQVGRDNFVIGLSLQQPLAPLTTERAGIKSARSELRLAQLRYDELQRELLDLALEGLRNLKRNRQELILSRQAEKSAYEAMELHRAKVQHGFGDEMEAITLEAEWRKRYSHREQQELTTLMTGWALLATIAPETFIDMITRG